MQLKYNNEQGEPAVCDMGEEPVVIGRDPDAQIVITDSKASRRHCEIRLWADDYVLKDLDSRNGTYVNEEAVNVHVLKAGDSIRIGSTVIACEVPGAIGKDTAIRQIQDEMQEGKGYGTILREIVEDIDKKGE